MIRLNRIRTNSLIIINMDVAVMRQQCGAFEKKKTMSNEDSGAKCEKITLDGVFSSPTIQP